MVQFEPPGYGRLTQPLGQYSPMALLWTFMGYSPLYTSFTGSAEVIGGVLLFFRGMGVGRELNLRPCALCLLVQGLGSSLKPKGESHVTSSLQALD